MTPLTRRIGPDMNRDTVSNVVRAGFELCREENVYFDVVKAIEARRPVQPRQPCFDADPAQFERAARTACRTLPSPVELS